MEEFSCRNCKDVKWVCESHPNKAWEDECDCGAGMPCPECTPMGGFPGLPPGAIPLIDVNSTNTRL